MSASTNKQIDLCATQIPIVQVLAHSQSPKDLRMGLHRRFSLRRFFIEPTRFTCAAADIFNAAAISAGKCPKFIKSIPPFTLPFNRSLTIAARNWLWLRRHDLNAQSFGHEPNEIPFLHSAMFGLDEPVWTPYDIEFAVSAWLSVVYSTANTTSTIHCRYLPKVGLRRFLIPTASLDWYAVQEWLSDKR